MDWFLIMGSIGLIFIVAGVLIRQRTWQDACYIIGGVFLLTYSIHLQNAIFITLQVIFILAAIYDEIEEEFFIKKH
jgi:hypothetical protein